MAGLRRHLDVTDSMYWQATEKRKRKLKYQPEEDSAGEAERKRKQQKEQDKEDLLLRIGQAVTAVDTKRLKQRAKYDAEAARQLAESTKAEQRAAVRKQQEAR